MLLHVAPCADLPVSVSLNETVREIYTTKCNLANKSIPGLSAVGKRFVTTRRGGGIPRIRMYRAARVV